MKQDGVQTHRAGEISITEDNANSTAEIIGSWNDSNVIYTTKEWASNWKEYGRTNESIIYENQNYIPIGFTYDYYITEDQLSEIDVSVRSNLLLKALVLTVTKSKSTEIS